MAKTVKASKTKDQEIEELKNRLAEAEDTLEAIRTGAVDALVVSGEEGEKIFSLHSVDQAYRIMVENMNEGAVSLDKIGVVVFANKAFSDLVGPETSSLVGTRFISFLPSQLHDAFTVFFQNCRTRAGREEFYIGGSNGHSIPVSISGTVFQAGDTQNICLILVDLRERKNAEQKLWKAYQEVEKKVGERTMELRESEARFRSVLDNSMDVIYRLDAETGDYVYISPGCEKIVGYSSEELMNLDAEASRAMIHPEDLPAVQEAQARLVETGSTTADYRQRTKNGTYCWLSNHMSLTKDSTGRVLYRDGNIRDITERKQAEDAVVAAHRQTQNIIDNTTSIVYAFDREERFVMANATVAKLLNSTPEQMMGKRRHEFMPKEEADWHESNDRQVFEVGRALEFEEHSQLEGHSITWLTTKFPLRDAEGKIYAVGGFSTDISERKRGEEALHRSEERLRLAQESASVGIWDWNVQTGALDFTPELNKLYGLLPGTIKTYQDWRDRVHPDDIFLIETQRDEAIAKHEPFDLEFRGRHSSGGYRWISTKGGAIYDETGKTLRVLGVNIDITERKRAEDTFKTSELKYRRLFESAKDGILILDFETGLIVDVNKFLIDFLEYSFDDLLNKHLWDIGVFKDVVVSKEAFAELQKKEFIRYEYLPLQTQNGQMRAVEFVSNVYLVDQTKVIQCNIRDITERKEAEEALKENQALLKTIINSTLDYISLKDREGRYVIVNAAAAASLKGATGIAAKDIIGKMDEDILPAEVAAPIKEIERKVISSGETFTFDQSFTVSGEHRTYSTVKSPTRSFDGSITGVVNLSRDITERKQRELELDKLNRSLRILGRSSQAMALATDELEYLNKVCSIIIQDSGHAMVWIGYAVGDENKTVRPVAYSGFEKGYLETRNLTWADTERGRGPTGTAIRTGKISICKNMLTDPTFEPWREEACKRGYCSSIGVPLTEQGKAFGAITIYSEKTDPFIEPEVQLLSELADDLSYGIQAIRLRLALEESEILLRKHADQLAETNKELESFSYSVSHDLRGPLRAIKGFSSMMIEDYASMVGAEGKEILTRIMRSTDKMSNLIDDLLSLSKISHQEMTPEEIDLGGIAVSIVEDLQQAEPQRKVEVMIAREIKASGDKRLMNIALSNLIGNAWKYSSKQPLAKIEIGCIDGQSGTVYFVKDNGAGFDMALAEKLFAPFQRLHSDSQFAGTGIGLAIVEKIIHRHGGSIRGESEIGKGATFYFTLNVDKKTTGEG